MVNAQRFSKSFLLFGVFILYAVSLKLNIWPFVFNESFGCMHRLCLDHLIYLNEAGNCSWSSLRSKTRLVQNKKLAFVGDSRMRLMYSNMADLLMHSENVDRLYTEPLDARDIRNDVSFWIPDLNATLYYHRVHQPNDLQELTMFDRSFQKEDTFDYVFFETGAWSLFNGGLDVLLEFRRNLTDAAAKMALLPRETLVIWMQTLPFHPHVKSQRTRWVVERGAVYRDVEKFGRIVREVGDEHDITMWRSAHDLALQHPEMYADRVHPSRQLYQKFTCQLFAALDWQNCPLDGEGKSRSDCIG